MIMRRTKRGVKVEYGRKEGRRYRNKTYTTAFSMGVTPENL
jgi:hypothetical protein